MKPIGGEYTQLVGKAAPNRKRPALASLAPRMGTILLWCAALMLPMAGIFQSEVANAILCVGFAMCALFSNYTMHRFGLADW